MSSCKLIIVRHGQSEHNRDDIVSGHVDPQLTELGRQQALETKTKLASYHFDEVYSSDLQRAIDTASLIFGDIVPKDHQLSDLRERHFGVMEGKPNQHFKNILKQNEQLVSSLSESERWRHAHVDGYESNYELAERFMAALSKIAEQNPGKTVLVAAHGGTLRTTLVTVGYATEAELPGGSIANAAFAELNYHDSQFTYGTVVGANKR